MSLSCHGMQWAEETKVWLGQGGNALCCLAEDLGWAVFWADASPCCVPPQPPVCHSFQGPGQAAVKGDKGTQERCCHPAVTVSGWHWSVWAGVRSDGAAQPQWSLCGAVPWTHLGQTHSLFPTQGTFLCLQFPNKLYSWWQLPSLSRWKFPTWFLDAQKSCWRWAKKRLTNRISNKTKTESPIRKKIKVTLGNPMDHPPWLLQPGTGWCDCPDMRHWESWEGATILIERA